MLVQWIMVSDKAARHSNMVTCSSKNKHGVSVDELFFIKRDVMSLWEHRPSLLHSAHRSLRLIIHRDVTASSFC